MASCRKLNRVYVITSSPRITTWGSVPRGANQWIYKEIIADAAYRLRDGTTPAVTGCQKLHTMSRDCQMRANGARILPELYPHRAHTHPLKRRNQRCKGFHSCGVLSLLCNRKYLWGIALARWALNLETWSAGLTSSRNLLSFPGSPTTMGAPQSNQPPANATQAQLGDTGPPSTGRGVGRWGSRLWNSFRKSFRKFIRTAIRCGPEHSEQTSSVSLEYLPLLHPSSGV